MTISDIVDRNRAAIVMLRIVRPQQAGGGAEVSVRGTGFLTSPDGVFATAAHVYQAVPEAERPYLEAQVPRPPDADGVVQYDSFPVDLAALDQENDLALMRLRAGSRTFRTIERLGDPRAVREGDAVVFLGHPLATELLGLGFGITMSVNHATISAVKIRGSDKSLHYFMMDTHVNTGSSGSPLFSCLTGEVVGVVGAAITVPLRGPSGSVVHVPSNIGICRPAHYLAALASS